MTGSPITWPARLSPKAAKVLADLPDHAQQTARDVLDIASRTPWGWPQWDTTDPDGEDLRTAAIGPLTCVYWINRAAGRLHVIDIAWLG
ncbi:MULTISPECIES: hypothetical protein [Streptomycetaceae]|uniref:hypothetical protein n=1 Tax=Streptomycetaceae TaxID=2062 RepID=UPI00093EFD03|nr:hypothetical protein [Streptomyces sp. CB02056]OKH97499.1 hypothetical protein AMK13_37895 [Streptomyces sp. CB02056]